MGKYFEQATTQGALKAAWSRIRHNGQASPSLETRSQVARFDQDVDRNIRRLQSRLHSGQFEFDPQKGVLKQKASGNGKRGIVMASVQNRIVERALLDCLQDRSSYVRQVLEVPTSVGGVPYRSVPHGLAEIQKAFDDGMLWFARSDITGFFDNIPRAAVIAEIGKHVDDEEFLSLLDRATSVVLGNELALGDDRRCFPTDEQGVAQGSPLSPLLGNILLLVALTGAVSFASGSSTTSSYWEKQRPKSPELSPTPTRASRNFASPATTPTALTAIA